MSEVPVAVRYKVSVDKAMAESDNRENGRYHFKTCLLIVFEDEMWNLSLTHSPCLRRCSVMLG